MIGRILAHVRSQYAGFLALAVALGGTSYAAATGSIDSREIKNGTVRSADIRNNQVRSSDVANGSLLVRDFRRGQLPDGPRGPQGVRGPAGATDVVTRTASTTINGSGSGGALASCDPGERATGGGIDPVGAGSGDAVLISRPVRTPGAGPPAPGQAANGWYAVLGFTNGNGRTLTTYVICARP